MGRRILFVHGLHPSVTARDLAYEFERCGEIVRCDIPPSRGGRSDAAYAFVEFYESRDAERAYNDLHGRPFMGGSLKIQWAKSAPRRSRRDSRSRSRSRGRADRRRSMSPRRRSTSPRGRSRSRSRSASPIRSRSRSASPPRFSGAAGLAGLAGADQEWVTITTEDVPAADSAGTAVASLDADSADTAVAPLDADSADTAVASLDADSADTAVASLDADNGQQEEQEGQKGEN